MLEHGHIGGDYGKEKMRDTLETRFRRKSRLHSLVRTDPIGTPGPVGRPPLLSDDLLLVQRDFFLSILEDRWTEFAWKLGHARNIKALVSAFSLMADSRNPLLEPFSRNVPKRADFDGLRTTKCKLETIRAQGYEARKKLETELRRVEEVRTALKEARKALNASKRGRERQKALADLKTVRTESERRECLYEKTRKSIADSEATEKVLRGDLTDQEALFAQTELLRFVTSRQYALTPRNLAMAMAGLPCIGYRQSLRRCKSLPHDHVERVNYQVFRGIMLVLKKRNPRSAQQAEQVFQRSIPELSKELAPARGLLAENWSDLRAAIHDAWRLGVHPGTRAFIITARFLKRVHGPKTKLQRVLDESQRIALPFRRA